MQRKSARLHKVEVNPKVRRFWRCISSKNDRLKFYYFKEFCNEKDFLIGSNVDHEHVFFVARRRV